MSNLIKDIRQLREDVNKLQDDKLSTTILTRIFKQYESLQVRVRIRSIGYARGRYCSEETLCADEARLR